MMLSLSQICWLLASELNKEEPPGSRYASGRDETLASELSLDGLYEISFRSFVALKKLSYTCIYDLRFLP